MAIPEGVDEEKLAEVALALLWLSAHSDSMNTRVWKGLDWDVMDLLFEKGWISDPKSKAKSVVLFEEAQELAENLFRKHFEK